MYISQFFAVNYRSLKEVCVRLENGKNVIVGKNNSGKSNIIKGLEILIGEKFPTYQNITANDFHTCEVIVEDTGEVVERVASNMYLEATLEGKDFDEDLLNLIKKSTAFSQVRNVKDLYQKSENGIQVNFDLFQSLDEVEGRPEIVTLGQNNGGFNIKTSWKKPSQLIDFLKNSKRIKVFFCKNRHDDEKSGFGLIVQDSAGAFWLSHFLPKKLRDSLITTTVISALRSHKEELRLVHYTWFGKLMKGLWNKNKSNIEPISELPYEDLIKDNSENIKGLIDKLFAKETEDIRKILEGAIAYKKVSFKFMNDTQEELYKNIQLFIHDGIDRPLAEKGTGIQSAIIISLFSMYCDSYHNNSSLLIAEEPELFLHPQARRVISAELNKFLSNCEEQPRQLIISTHSTEYLKNVDPFNIIRVSKNTEKNCSVAHQLQPDVASGLTMEIKRFLWSNNTEIFFSDKAILVEGGEIYLIPAIVDLVADKKQHLDYENVTVARVDGKGNFLNYIKMLQCFKIAFVVLGDLDCFKDVIPKIANHLNLDHLAEPLGRLKAVFSEMSIDYKAIGDRIKGVDKNLDAQDLQRLFEKVSTGTIASDDVDLMGMITYMQSRYTKGNKYDAIVTAIGTEEYQRIHQALRASNVFIWSEGDLESCYTDAAKSIKASKDITALTIGYKLQAENASLDDFFQNVEEIRDLVSIILEKNEKMIVVRELETA